MASLHMSPNASGASTQAPSTPAEAPVNPFSRPSTPEPRHDRIGFVGLGNMGTQMALNLAIHLQEEGQPPLLVWNRSAGRIDKFKELCAEGKDGKKDIPFSVAASVEEIGEKCDIVLTSMGSDEAALSIYDQLFKGQEKKNGKGDGIVPGGSGKSSIYIDTSTLYPTTVGEIERSASKGKSRHFISSPAFGRPTAAADKTLLFAVAGEYHAKKHATHLLVPALGRKAMDLGSNVEKAASFKLVGNSMILGVIELLSESMTLADQSGVGASQLYQLIQELYPAPTFLGYAKKLLQNDFSGKEGFTLDGGIKDAHLIRRLGEECNVPLPITDIAHQHLVAARANGGSDLDWSALVGGQRLSAGLPPFKSTKPRLERYE